MMTVMFVVTFKVWLLVCGCFTFFIPVDLDLVIQLHVLSKKPIRVTKMLVTTIYSKNKFEKSKYIDLLII